MSVTHFLFGSSAVKLRFSKSSDFCASLSAFVSYVDQPIIEKDHKLPLYGGNPQLLAKTPQYIIFRCHWPAHEYYELAADYTPRGCHDSAPMWACRITKEQADNLLAHTEQIGPFFARMQNAYPYGD